MWNLSSFTATSGQNGSILQNQRHFSTFHSIPSINNNTNKKSEPITNSLNLLHNWTSRIMPGKSFTNPNFVNQNNPRIHTNNVDCQKIAQNNKSHCQNSAILEKCTKFLDNNEHKSTKSQTKDDDIPLETLNTMCKTNRHEKKQQQDRKKKQKRKNKQQKQAKKNKRSSTNNSNHSKSKKNTNNRATIKMDLNDIDEIGIDISSELSNDVMDVKDNKKTSQVFNIKKETPCKILETLSSSPLCVAFGTLKGAARVVFSISPPRNILRRLSSSTSECDSEDSFIIFENNDAKDCNEEIDFDDDDTEDDEYDDDNDASEEDEDDSDDEAEDEDVVDFVQSPAKTDKRCCFFKRFKKVN